MVASVEVEEEPFEMEEPMMRSGLFRAYLLLKHETGRSEDHDEVSHRQFTFTYK